MNAVVKFHKKYRKRVLALTVLDLDDYHSFFIYTGNTFFNPLRISVLYTGHQEQKNKWKNKAKTMKEQWTKEIEFNLWRVNDIGVINDFFYEISWFE